MSVGSAGFHLSRRTSADRAVAAGLTLCESSSWSLSCSCSSRRSAKGSQTPARINFYKSWSASTALDLRAAGNDRLWFSYLLDPLRTGDECKVSGAELQGPPQSASIRVNPAGLDTGSQRETRKRAGALPS